MNPLIHPIFLGDWLSTTSRKSYYFYYLWVTVVDGGWHNWTNSQISVSHWKTKWMWIPVWRSDVSKIFIYYLYSWLNKTHHGYNSSAESNSGALGGLQDFSSTRLLIWFNAYMLTGHIKAKNTKSNIVELWLQHPAHEPSLANITRL